MKLTKIQTKELSAYSNRLCSAWQDLEEAVDNYNENKIEENKKKVEDEILLYNEAQDSAKGFVETIVGEIEEFIDGKSEGWQEGEKGEAHTAWKEQWEEVVLDPVTWGMLESEEGGDLSLSDLEPGNDVLDGLATEAEV